MRSQERNRLEQFHIELLWRRYADDPAAFFRECVWIPSQRDERGREKFDLLDYQEADLETLLTNKFVTVLKARQIGMSTLIGGIALWQAMFRPGTVVLWVSNNQDNANKAISMLETMWHFLPDWVQERAPELTSNQAGKKEWTFKDGMKSRIRAYAGTKTSGASETASIVVLDEFALVDPHIQTDLVRSAEPTTDSGGQLWMLSTARGGHNKFAKTFRNAQRGESQYVPIFHPWTESPFVTQEMYEAKKREYSDEPWKIHAEYPETVEEAFRESGNPRFPHLPDLEDCFDGWVRGRIAEGENGPYFVPAMSDKEPGHLHIREDVAANGPDSWREYVLYVDPAKGVGGDYTAAHVLTYDDDALPDIVAWWHANDVEPVPAARRFDMLGRWFGSSTTLAVEIQGGYGDSMLNELNLHLNYRHLYVHTPTGRRSRTRGNKLGFPMHYKRRPLVIDRLADYLKEEKRVGHIYPLLRYELGTFVRTEKGKVQADAGCHDDLVMSLAGGLWVLIEEADATSRPNSEEPEDRNPHSLQNLWDRIEEARAKQQEKKQRMNRRVKRRMRRSRRRRSSSSRRR